VSSGRVYTFTVLVMLIAAVTVNASPTVFSDCPSHPASVKADNTSNNSACNLISGVADNRIAELANDFLQPPASFDAGRDGQSSNNRTSLAGNMFLPAVPPALFMVLTGFFCVSMVRDRRTWIAVLAGVLWLGQAGFNALPELTSRLSRKIHTCSPIEPELLTAYPLGGVYYPESYNEQTRYAGLLHHLEGIPRRTSNLSKINVDLSPSLRPALSLSNGSLRPQWCSFASQHAIIAVLSSLGISYCCCLVRLTRQFISFTPAFIFTLIPRGPPIPS
jgi:hypothetical protein